MARVSEREREREGEIERETCSGRTDTFKFIIMELVSHSLETLRKDVLKKNFRLGPRNRLR